MINPPKFPTSVPPDAARPVPVNPPAALGSPSIVGVSVVEDDGGYRNLLSVLLAQSPGFRLRSAHSDVAGLLDSLQGECPQIILMDIELPGCSGVEGVKKVLDLFPSALVVMLTAFDDHAKVFQSLQAGAVGYLLKSASLVEILSAVQDALRGGSPMSGPIARMVVRSMRTDSVATAPEVLSEREAQLVALLAEGLRYKEVADRMGISLNTVRSYIRRAYEKLQAQSRTEAVRNRRKA